MLIIIPFLAIVLGFLDLLGWQQEGVTKLTGWRVALIQVTLIMGVFIALQSELLSIFHLLYQPYVIGLWSLALLASAVLGIRKGLMYRGWKRLVASVRSVDWFTGLSLVAFSLIALLLLVIVVKAPPNNTDSLQYHMSRVMHWAQDRSLAHYPVGYEAQLTNLIGAELSILQLRMFTGNDLLANLPQWISMILSAVAVSLGAGILRAGRKGQLAAAAFAISLPMGILQATSTQNDYVTALWLSILVVFVLYASKAEPGWVEILTISSALGLGLLTKGTFYPFAVPWGIWLGVHWLKKKQWTLFAKRGVVIVFIVIVLNAGYWTRNLVTYGGPLGPSQWVAAMSSAEKGAFRPLASNLVKNILLNFSTPSYELNDRIANLVRTTFERSDPTSDFQLYWRWNFEDIAGDPIHVLLIAALVVIILWLALRRQLKEHQLYWYTLAAIASFVAFTLAAHFDQYGTRYELPLMVIWAPVFGMVITKINERWLAPLAMGCFFVISLPYVIFNSTRPIIAMKGGPEPYAIPIVPGLENTRSSSIFFADQQTVLFANWPNLEKPYVEITQDVLSSGCTNVGLRIDSHDLEYPFWWLLRAPQSGIRIESIYYSDTLTRYADPTFKPCAIICTICGDRTRLHGLNLFSNYDSGISLFVGDSYSPDEDK